MPAQGEVNRCHAATIVEFLEERTDNRVHGIGHLTRLTFETLALLVVKYAGAREITNTAEATAILQKISYGTAFLQADKYASAALKNMQLDAEADTEEFIPIPKGRGRKPHWDETDDVRLRASAEKALANPKIQKLLEQLRNGNDSITKEE